MSVSKGDDDDKSASEQAAEPKALSQELGNVQSPASVWLPQPDVSDKVSLQYTGHPRAAFEHSCLSDCTNDFIPNGNREGSIQKGALAKLPSLICLASGQADLLSYLSMFVSEVCHLA